MADLVELDNLLGLDGDAKRDQATWILLDRKRDKRDPETGDVKWEGPPWPTRLNLRTVLQNDPAYADHLRYNAFTGRLEWKGEKIADHMEEDISLHISSRYRFEMAARTLGSVAAVVGREKQYHPVRDYLRSLVWDGECRHDAWLSAYLGAVQSPLTTAVGCRWFTSAVARIMQPGCKVDTVLILVGPQGAKKSTAFRVLAGSDYFSDTALDLRNKDALLALQGIWLYEFAELDNMRRKEATAVKAFLAAQQDRFRPPYGRHMIEWDRQCIIVGTTNEQVFLNDSTGSRRFWPVEVGSIDLDALAEDRDQLWAEAVARYDDGQPWWLSEAMETQRTAEAEVRTSSDPWEELIARWSPAREFVTVADVLDKAIKKDPDRWTRGDEMRVADLLSGMGYRKGTRKRHNGALVRPWYVPTVPTSE